MLLKIQQTYFFSFSLGVFCRLILRMLLHDVLHVLPASGVQVQSSSLTHDLIQYVVNQDIF